MVNLLQKLLQKALRKVTVHHTVAQTVKLAVAVMLQMQTSQQMQVHLKDTLWFDPFMLVFWFILPFGICQSDRISQLPIAQCFSHFCVLVTTDSTQTLTQIFQHKYSQYSVLILCCTPVSLPSGMSLYRSHMFGPSALLLCSKPCSEACVAPFCCISGFRPSVAILHCESAL